MTLHNDIEPNGSNEANELYGMLMKRAFVDSLIHWLKFTTSCWGTQDTTGDQLERSEDELSEREEQAAAEGEPATANDQLFE